MPMLSTLCHNETSLTRLPEDERDFVAGLSDQLGQNSIISPFEGRQVIWKSLNNKGLRVPSGLFENIATDDSLEMWTADLRFLFAMGSIIHKSSYSLDTLATHPWAELFSRDPSSMMQALTAWKAAMETGETQHDVTDWHWVRETRSPRMLSILLKIKQITPFQRNGVNAGIIALVKTGAVLSDPQSH